MRFVHTADLQIGMPFEWAQERSRSKLQERREEVIGHICELAVDHSADFILVAGDFFDANTVGDDVVMRTCERLDRSDIPIFILPGNHDFASGPNCVYERAKFVGNRPENVFVLAERKPHVIINGKAVILPAPIFGKHEMGDTTSHLKDGFGRDEAPDAIRIGLAHGGVVDFNGSESACRIAPDRCEQAGLDYLALGDWHGFKQISDRTWYSGAPEPTGFKQNDPGYVALVEIGEAGDMPVVERVSTSQTDWVRHSAELRETGDLDELERWIKDIERPLDTVVRLEMSGALSISERTRLNSMLGDLEDKILHLRRRGLGVQTRADMDEIDAIATDGYVRDAVEELQAQMSKGGDGARAAGDALQLLHRMKTK